MAFNLGDIFVTFKARTEDLKGGIAQVKAGIDSVQQNINKTSFAAMTAKASSAFGSIADGIENVAKKLFIVAAASSWGASKFINLASDLQTAQQRMSSLAGDTVAAKKAFGELYNYTLGKPIAFPDAAKAAQTLMGYGVGVKDVVASMKTLSAFSVVNGADMGQLALAYGQVNAKGRLMGQEILQLTNNFVPVSQVIAKHFNVSLKEAQALMEDGKVSAADFNAAMAEFIPQEKIAEQANTFKNRMISLQGTIRNVALSLLGVKVDPQLGLVVEPGGVFDRLSLLLPKIAKGLKDLKPLLVGGIGWLIEHGDVVKAVLVGIASAWAAAKVAAIGFGIASAFATGGMSLIIPAIVAAIGVIAALQSKFDIFGKIFQMFKPEIQGVMRSFDELKRALMDLWKVLEPILMPILKAWGKLLGIELVLYVKLLLFSLKLLTDTLTFVVDQITLFINDVKKGIDNAKRAFESFKKTVSDTVENVKSKFNEMKDRAESTFSKMKDAMKPWVEDFSGSLKKALKGAAEALIKHDKEILDRWKNGLDNMVAGVKEWGRQTGEQFKYSIDQWQKGFESFFTGLPERVKNWFIGVKDAIVNWFTTTWEDMKTGLNNFGQSFQDFFTNLPQKFSDSFNRIKDNMVAWFSNLGNDMSQPADQAGKGMGDKLKDGMKSIFGDSSKMRQIGDAILMGIGLIVGSVLISLVDAGARMAIAIVNGLGQLRSRADQSIRSGISGAINAVGSFVGSAVSAGRNIVNGLVNGIAGGAGAIVNKIREICASALGAVKKFFGIKSPSKVMQQQGDYIMQGFGIGILKGVKGTIRAARDASAAVMDSMDTMSSFGMNDLGYNVSAAIVGGSSNAAAIAGAAKSYNNMPVTAQTNVYIDKVDHENRDYIISKINRNQELAAKGIATQSGSVGTNNA